MKKFGLKQLEKAGKELGPLDAATARALRVAAVVMEVKWVVPDEVKAAKVAAEAQATDLRQQATLTRGNARKYAETLRRQAQATEDAANKTANGLETTAGQRETRANQLDGYAALLK